MNPVNSAKAKPTYLLKFQKISGLNLFLPRMKYTFDLKKNYQEGHSNRRRQSRVAWRNDPGKPAQNGRVERSHRTDQEMFYDRRKFKTVLGLKLAIRKWNEDYNNLEHCALDGLTPNETLARVQNVCA